MKKTIFRCLVCSEEFETLDECEYHLEHSDSNHDYMREKLGIPTLIQAYTFDTEEVPEKEDGSQTTLQDLRNLKPLPKDFTDKAEQYPYPPYYRHEYYGKEHYLCAEHNIEVTDPKEFLRHLTEIQTHKEDIEHWLLNHTKRVIHNRIRHEKGSSMRLSDEDLDRYAETEIKELMFGLELQAPQPERMTGIVLARNQKLSKFVQGEATSCPLCGVNTENLGGDAKDEYYEKEILSQLKPTSGLTQKYETSWSGEKILACLKCNMHLHLKHKETYKQLFTSGIYTGGLVQWLATEAYLSKKPMVEELMKSGVPVDKNLNPKDKDMLKWLGRR